MCPITSGSLRTVNVVLERFDGLMWRDIGLLSTKKFDLLIIGGGIHGVTIAREAAEAGFSVALVEQHDFCSGVSANSLKVIHGGIRYLQHLDIKRMRESIRSRNRLLREFPHLVRPMPCLTPTYGHGMKGREVMAVALKLNDLIAWDRNKGLDEKSVIPSGYTMGRRECLAITPGIREQGLTGAAVWYDGLAVNTERLVLEFLHQAVHRGAVVANHTVVEGFQRCREGSITGVHFTDTPSGEKYTIHPRFIINAGGAGIDSLAALGGQKNVASGWAKAVNLLVSKSFFGDYAVGLEGVREFYDRDAVVQKGKRLFFFVPWRGKTMIGTTYTHHGDSDAGTVSSAEIDEFLLEVNRIYPPAALSRADVDHVHCGLVPVLDREAPEQGDVRLDKTTVVVNHDSSRHGANNFFTVKGVKYTTAVEVAGDVVRMVGAKLGFPSPSRSEGTDSQEVAPQWGSEVDPEVLSRLTEKYGPRARRVSVYLKGEGSEVLCRDPWCVRAEILHGIREEAALHLADILFRRTDLASGGCPAQKVVERVATIMAEELAWSEEQRLEEIRGVLEVFAIFK